MEMPERPTLNNKSSTASMTDVPDALEDSPTKLLDTFLVLTKNLNMIPTTLMKVLRDHADMKPEKEITLIPSMMLSALTKLMMPSSLLDPLLLPSGPLTGQDTEEEFTDAQERFPLSMNSITKFNLLELLLMLGS